MAITTEYTAESIQVLTGLEAVRRRPGMYIGGVDDAAMHVCLWEVISNSFDECLGGHCDHIAITFDGARVTVEDEGRGIPIDELPSGVPALELVLTSLHGGSPWRPAHMHLSPLLYGIGVAVTNALASTLDVTVWRDGHAFHQHYARGTPLGPVERGLPTTRTGTRISFVPDVTIFGDRSWDIPAIAARCRTLAALWPGLTFTVDDEVYRYDSLSDYVDEVAGCELLDPLIVRSEHAGIVIQLALAWTRNATSSLATLVNGSSCEQGTHVEALFAALHDVLGPRTGMTPRRFRSRITRGLVGVLHVQLAEPRFGNPTRDWLRNPEVGEAVHAIVATHLARHLADVPALLDALVLDLAPRVTPTTRVRVRLDGRRL